MSVSVENAFELSIQQKKILSLHKRGQACQTLMAFAIHQELDDQLLRQAMDHLVTHHEIFHTVLQKTAGLKFPRQIITEPQDIAWRFFTRTDLPLERVLQETWQDEQEITLDQEHGPSMRVTHVKIAEEQHLLLVHLPAAYADISTVSLLTINALRIYKTLQHGGNMLDALDETIQYADFAGWQLEVLDEMSLADIPAHWARKLAPQEPLAIETTDTGTGNIPQSEQVTIPLDHSVLTHIQSLATHYQVTEESFLLTCWYILLYRLSQKTEISIDYLDTGRQVDELQQAMGAFEINLPLFHGVDGDMSFAALLVQIEQDVERTRQVEDAYLKVLNALLEQDTSDQHIYSEHAFRYRNNLIQDNSDNYAITVLREASYTHPYKWMLSCVRDPQKLLCSLHYDRSLYTQEFMITVAQHLKTLIEHAVRHPGLPLDQLNLMDDYTAQRLFTLLNGPAHQATYSPIVATLPELFEKQVLHTPHQRAVVSGDEFLTFSELSIQANQLAHFLRNTYAIGADVLVVLCMERSLDMIVGVLGILKAGGAYLPLDPDSPSSRLNTIIHDAQPALILTQKRLQERLPQNQVPIVCIDESKSIIAQENSTNPVHQIQPQNLAYSIYTSGTSGRPKGVLIQHQSVMHLLSALQHEVYAHLNAESSSTSQQHKPLNIAVNGSLTFDTSIKQIIQMYQGHTLHLIPAALRFEPEKLLRYIHSHHVDVIDCTPSQLQLWLDAGLLQTTQGYLKGVLIGGEAIPASLWKQLHNVNKEEIKFFNLYGPTECTVDTTVCFINNGQNMATVSIGHALPGTHIAILDRYARLVPIGVPGELYIGGKGVARGYLNDAGLTASKFVPDYLKDDGSRLYRTGDIVRYHPNGSLEFLGRQDRQVKIRGYRVELGDIEARLSQHPTIKEAVVLTREEEGKEARLAAYIVTRQGSPLDIRILRAYLLDSLPDYMVPATFTFLGTLPLTAHGKVDYRALQAISVDEGPKDSYVAPRTETEKILAQLWREILSIEQIGIHDNFFELGGDSIMCIQLTARAKQHQLHLSPVLIFQHQTLEALAKAVNTTSKNIKEIEVEQSLVVGEVPLTPIQYRFFERNLQEPNHWNQSLYLELSQPLSQALIQRALTMLVEHHDALRLRFHQEHGNQWQQENIGYTNDHEHHAKDSYLHLTWHDLSAYSDEELPSIIDQLALVAQSSLDISNGPLLKAVYFSLDTSHNDRLLLVIHHLAVDGVSWRILLEDLETLIHQFINEQPGSLPAKTTSYRDWAQQLQSYAQSQQIQAELSYWQTQTTIEGGTLPHDSISEEASKKNTVGSTERLLATMNAEDTQKLLHDIRVVHHAQMHEVLLAALFTTITHWSGTETLLIDLEGHGREEHIGNVDLSRTVGWFTTVYPVCLQRSTRNTAVDEVLQQVKQSIRQIPAKGLGYGLLRYLTSQDNGSSPLAGATQAEICFNYLGQFDQKTATPHYVKIREEACGSDMSLLAERLYLFELDISIVNDQLLVVWTYSRNLHTEQTVQLLMQEFLQTLRQFMITTRPKAEQVQSLVPSDFPLATVTQNQLDTLLAKYGRIEDVYGLPPIQSCMLQRSIHAPRYGQYLYQWSLDLNRRLEEATFVQSWQEIVNEQPAWRTAFSWSESGDMLLQVVQQEVQLPVIRFDWRTLSAEKQEQQENSYLQHTQQQGFDLSQPPLLSLALARLAEARYKVIMTFSLLVVDVPSFALLLDAVLQRYEQLCKRQQAQSTTQIADSSEISSQDLPERTPQDHPSYSYKEYIEWVQQQDEEAARAFWQHYLKGFSSPTPLLAQMASTDAAIRKGYIDHFIFLSDELTSALQKFARRHQFTLYSILQGIWAIYLKEATGHNDVVYGTIVSGRPTALENAQYRIGRFVNFVPIRMHIPESGTFVNWVKAAQKSLFELLQYEYVSAEQINEWCGFERYRHCYHSLVAYENAPLQDLIAAPHWQGANALKIIQDPEVPIKVTGSLFDRLRITIAYIPTAIEHEKVTAMLERIVTLLEQLVQNEEDGFLFETFNTAH